jgi:hypothetical protein
VAGLSGGERFCRETPPKFRDGRAIGVLQELRHLQNKDNNFTISTTDPVLNPRLLLLIQDIGRVNQAAS